MKRVITKAEQEALSPELKLEYVAQGDVFVLSLTDFEDPAELRRANDRNKEEARIAKEKATALETELTTLKAASGTRKEGDIATLEASWQRKLDESKLADKAVVDGLKKTIENTLIQHAAQKLAGEITGTPANAGLMIPHIMPRLEVVYDGETPTVKIKDKAGRVSAMNFDELKSEFVNTPTFASVVVVSRASGAGGSGGGTGSSNGGAGGAKKKFSEMSGTEKSELFKSDPNYFQQLSAEDKAAREATRFTR